MWLPSQQLLSLYFTMEVSEISFLRNKVVEVRKREGETRKTFSLSSLRFLSSKERVF